MPERMTFMVEDARIIFPNFSGRPSPFNREGSKNFAVVLDRSAAEEMAKEGWNVKLPKPGEEDERDPYISVQLGYSGRPPLIVMITSKGRRNLTEENVHVLDSVDLACADLICNASHWSNAQGSGIKAYLKTMYVTLEEDYLQLKYGMELPITRSNDDEDGSAGD